MAKQKRIISKTPQPQTYIVQASGITSSEMYRYPNGQEEPVLFGITLDVKRGECWGIVGDEPFELEILMQIIANVRPYGSGHCALVERGMMRRKRAILPHVFFISGGDTVPGNLNTIEYLMYVTARIRVPDRKRQAYILEALLASGLYYLTLVPMKYLTIAERAAICLLSAALSSALLVVFSVPGLTFPPDLTKGILYIVNKITKFGGAVLIGATDCGLAQEACTHAAFLINGQLSQTGRMDALLAALDQRALILTTDQPAKVADTIRAANDWMDVYEFGNEVHIYTRDENKVYTQAAIMQILLNYGLTVDSMQISKPTLQNAYREVLAGHVI